MQKIEILFDKIYKVIAVFALSCLITPFANLVFFQDGVSPILVFILPLMLLTIGYFIQATFAKITKIKRQQQDLSYESNTKYFSITQSALPIAICIGLSIFLYKAVVEYMKYRVVAGIDLMFDLYSVYPFTMMCVGSIIMIMGVVAWFYPYNRMLSMRNLFVYFSLFLIGFGFTIFVYEDQFVSTICMIMFLLCALIILNQSSILRTIKSTKIGIATAHVRLYNAGTVILFILAVLASLIFVASILVGLTVVGMFLLYLALGVAFRDPNDYIAQERAVDGIIAPSSDVTVLGLSFGSGYLHALWYLFVLIVVVTILLLIFRGKINKVLKTIRDFFGALINNIISLLTDVFFFFSKGDRDEIIEYVNYRDEELDVDKISAKLKMQEFSKKRYSYKDYTNKFNSMRTVSEKYKFAYQTLVDCWGNIDFSLRGSDTPRQIKDKVLARTTINEIPEITAIFEQYHYGNIETDSDIVSKLIVMNKLIEKYYD